MRMSQAKGEPAEFLNLFGEIVNAVHPAYARNMNVRGVRTEFLREVIPGVYASHNVYCRKGTYHHGFCITLHKELPTPYLNSPFTLGGRFDHNLCVNKAIRRDLGRHMLLSDTHNFRKGCEGIITRCLSLAESSLLPHYISSFNASKNALWPLVELIFGETAIPEVTQRIRGSGYHILGQDCDMLEFTRMFQTITGDRMAFLNAILASKPELFQRLRESAALKSLFTGSDQAEW